MRLPALPAWLRGGAQEKPGSSAQTDPPASKRRAGWSLAGLAGLFAGGNDLLVLAEDAAGLSAVVARKDRDGAIVLGAAVFEARRAQADEHGAVPSRTALLSAALAQLRQGGERVPRRAAVVSAAALAALADLPVDPAKPKSPLKVFEMVRYELEPGIAGHNSLWTLGEILAARGVLDAQGRRAVADAMLRTRSGPLDGSLRFGETVVSLGLATRAEVDAALHIQQELQILESEIACGWRGYLVRTPSQGRALPHWLTAALGATARQEWLAALEACDLRPAGFWPRAGLAGAHGQSTGRLALALEIWPEQVIRLRLSEGQVVDLASEPRLEQAVTAEWLADQVTDWLAEPLDQVRLLVADGQTAAQPLATALQPLLRCAVTLEAASPQAMARCVWQAAAREVLSGAPAFVAIPPRDPRPPLWKRPGVRRAMPAAAAALALLSWQGHAWWRIHAMQQERNALVQKLEARRSSEAESQNLAQEAQALDRKANALREQLAAAMARADLLELLVRRTTDVPALIRALGQAITPVVVLDGLREGTESDPHIGIEVRAWSPDNGAVQAYAAAVQTLVAERGLSVAQSNLRTRAGRDGTMGYEVSFWLVPSVDFELETKPSEPTAAPAGPNRTAGGARR